MKLLHTPTAQVMHLTDSAAFYLLKNGYAMNDRGMLKTDASPAYIKHLTERVIK